MEDSTLAGLKVSELLKEVEVEYGRAKAEIERGIAAIRQCFSQIPEEEVSLSLADAYLRDLRVPHAKAQFKFRRPESLELVGSFVTQTVAKPAWNVDLAVTMPKKCFYQKDYLNHRYHVKRALYLMVLRTHLMTCSAVQDVRWALQHSDIRKPILVVQLVSFKTDSSFQADQANGYVVQILPTINPTVFEMSKLAPSRNNLKEARLGGVMTTTPYYNSSIIEDMFISEHCAFLKNAVSISSALREGIILLKVWMRQRGLLEAPDSLNGFMMSMLLAHMVINGRLKAMTNTLTGFRMFRICLEAIANGDLLGKGLFMCTDAPCMIGNETKKTITQTFDVILFDISGRYNLSFRMTKNALEEIKEEALCTLAAIKGSRDHGFEEAFMTTVDYAAKFDYHIRIRDVGGTSEGTSVCYADEDGCRFVEKRVESLLCQSLGDRARLVRVIRRSLPAGWSIEKGVISSHDLPVTIGLKVSNFELAFRMIDIGPNADNKEKATKFRAFWGEKAELRRFKDGTIAEAVVWECKPWERHLIIPKIVQYVSSLHMSLSEQHIHVVAGQLDFALMEGKNEPISVTPKLLEAYDDFAKKLRSLEDLPLKISSIQPLSAAFRHAAVFPPQVHCLQRTGLFGKYIPSCIIDPLEVMIQLEGSGRWPSDRTAIEKTKVAFSLKIAESMQKLYGAICIAAEEAVDVLMHGFSFRLRIRYEKDPTFLKTREEQLPLLRRQIKPQPLKDPDIGPYPADDVLLRSVHSSMLNGLQGRYPIYSPTVRLAKRWVSSHLFSGILGDEAIELLVAHVFLNPAPFSSPLSRITGLLRFLRLLGNFDWGLSPLIVDINGDMKPEDIECILDYFNYVRNCPPGDCAGESEQGGPAMFVATAIDMRSLTWTRLLPSHSDMKRLVSYARSSASLLSQLVAGERCEQWLSLYKTPLHLYDIVLLLQRKKLAYPHRLLFPAEIEKEAIVTMKSLDEEPLGTLPSALLKDGLEQAVNHLLIGFDPTECFLQDLKRLNHLFSFWYGSLGSDVIGLTWKHPLPKKAPLKKRKRVEKDGVADTRKLLFEIAKVGGGFLKSIHLLSDQK